MIRRWLDLKPIAGGSTNPPEPNRVEELPTQQVVGGDRPPEPPVGAPPAAPAVPTPEGFVPKAAIVGEQANTKAARDQLAQMKAQMQLYGWQVGEDGSVSPPVVPQPAYQPSPPSQSQGQYGPQTSALASKLGIEAHELAGVINELGSPLANSFAGPIGEGMASLYEQNLRNTDPYFQVYEGKYREMLRSVPANLRTPQHLDIIRNAAKGQMTEQIAAKMNEMRGTNAQAVGRFTEGASPGSGGGPGATIPPEYDKLTSDLPPESKARIAENLRRRRVG